MKLLNILLAVVLLLSSASAAFNAHGVNLDVVTIYDVSTSIEELSYKPKGSVAGGTRVYIEAKGQDMITTQNQVMIGPYECKIPEKGVTENSIYCITSEAHDLTRLENLPVELFVYGKQQSICKGKCKFTYTQDATPLLRSITPGASAPNRDVNWNGKYKVSNTIDITKMLFENEKDGQFNCNRFQLKDVNSEPLNLNDDEQINANSWVDVPCTLSPEQIAGLYDAKLEGRWGNPVELSTLNFYTRDGSKQYQFAVTPEITYISQNEAGSAGSLLTIEGRGFGFISEDVVISAGGLDCEIQSIINNRITCRVAEGQTEAVDPEVSGQFLRGQGASVTYYSTSGVGNAKDLFNKVADGSASEKEGQSAEQIGTWNLASIGTHTGARVAGYFYAPRSGAYNFWVSGDDTVAVYISTVAQSQDLTEENLVNYRCSHSYKKQYLSPNDCGYRSEDVELVEGNYYWLEAYVVNKGGSGFFDLSVETPEIQGVESVNTVPNIKKYEIIPEKDNQIWSIKVWGYDSAYGVKFYYQDKNTYKTLWSEKTAEKTWQDWTAESFRDEISVAAGGFGPQVSEFLLDSQGNRCENPDDCEADGKEFVVEFTSYRAPVQYNQEPQLTRNILNTNYSIEKVQEQYGKVSGFYTLTVNEEPLLVRSHGEWTTQIPYNTNGSVIREGLVRLTGAQSISTDTQGSAESGYSILITFRSVTDEFSENVNFQFENHLVGEKPGTVPEIRVTDVVESSNRVLYEPIPFDMTFEASDAPAVTVTVNSVLSAVAVGVDNTYQAKDAAVPVITQYSISGNTLGFSLTAGSINFDNSAVQATFGYVNCGTYNGSQCTLVGTVEAGNHQPEVFIEGVGYAEIDPNFNAPNSPIFQTVTSINPTEAGVYGGIQATIVGNKFSQDKARTTVSFGNQEAQILSISNTEIVVVVPQAENISQDETVNVLVSVNGQDNSSLQFDYSLAGVPVLNSISPNKASPVQKGTITISGSGFGNDEDDIEVHLINKEDGSVAYNLYLQSVENTEIVATLSGGKSDDYDLKVKKLSKGYSLASQEFSYKIKVSDIQPRQGSLLGGTVITITGQNFSEVQIDNSVFFTQGDEKYNDQCTIQSATSTEIVCVTPPKNAEFDEDLPILVFVQGRFIEESVCEENGHCEFQYSAEFTPSLDEQEEAYQADGNAIVINGSGFPVGNDATIYLTQEISASGVILSETQIEFELPNVPAGIYGALVQVDNKGYAGIFAVDVQIQLDSVSPSSLSLIGGILTLSGQAFDTNAYITIGEQECVVLSRTHEEIRCLAPANNAGQKTVKLEQGGEESIVVESTVTYAQNSTPSLKFSDLNALSYNYDSINISVTNANLLDGTVTPYLFKKYNSQKSWAGSYTGSQLQFSGEIPAGKYYVYVEAEGKGFAAFEDANNADLGVMEIEVNFEATVPTQDTSLFGGNELVIPGGGFDLTNLNNNQVHVCGFQCIPTVDTTYENLVCTLPVVETSFIKSKNISNLPAQNIVLTDEEQGDKVPLDEVDPASTYVQFLADNVSAENLQRLQELGNSIYQSAGGEECWVGYDFGNYVRNAPKALTIGFNHITNTQAGSEYAERILNFQIQSSDDGINWETQLRPASATQTLHWGFRNDADIPPIRQYWRVYNTALEEGGVAFCEFTALRFHGFNYYAEEIEDDSTFTCDVSVEINGLEEISSQKIQYLGSTSSYVESVFPYYGWQRGGTEVTITGSNFGTDSSLVSVQFDEADCNVTSVSDTEIVCTTGDKGATNYSTPKMVVTVDGYNSVIPENVKFYYGLLWSEEASWGLEAAPRAGDSVFVAKGRTLIIDQSSPKFVDTVINEGRVIFADDGNDIEFHVRYFINRKSEFIVGTEQQPYSSNLTITLYGDLYDKQLPQYGVKVIACHLCTLDIHGTQKTPSWTFLDSTINPTDSTLTTKAETNWQIGDRLAIATTDFDGRHSEEVYITSITHNANGDTIEFQPELRYTHISVTETYGDKELNMWAEVGNLSRNVLIQGNPEDNDLDLFGGHVMMHGEGTIARIENAEFTRTGQPRIVGRYTMHFHMAGEQSLSYIRNNAVHNAYARIVALHDIDQLTVTQNVGYWVRGHNIFLENGTETDNVIEGNLVISPRSAFNMLQTDITVAGIWITSPTNFVSYNHIAGSQFYGLWYEIFARPESPNGLHGICPEGNPIGAVDHNVAHSNERFGLRIFRLSPRTFPCEPIRDDSLEDPWSENPSIESRYTNHTLWKNGESGLLAEEVGNSKFQDFILADNYFAGFQAHLTNFTREEVILEDSVIVGQSLFTQSLGTEELEYLKNAGQSAIVTSRTNGMRVRNTEIYNQQDGSYIVSMSSQNDFGDLSVQGGKQFNIENISITDSNDAKKLRWLGPRFNIVYDVDGTFSGTGSETYITPYYNTFDQPISDNKCTYDANAQDNFDDSILCTGTRLRAMPIGNLQDAGAFKEQTMKVINLQDADKMANFNTTDEDPADFGKSKQIMILNPAGDGSKDYAYVFATDYAYNVHWNSRLDWSHLQIYPSQVAQDDDKTIILRFNYTEQRELFDVFQREGKKLTAQYEQSFEKSLFYNDDGTPNSSAESCELGQYFIDQEFQTVSVCINNKGRTTEYQAVDVNGVYCRHTCPVIGFECEKETGDYRIFSEAENWIEQDGNLALRKRPEEEEYSFGVPQSGDDVIIPCPWTMVFNVADFEFGTLIIDGTLLIDDNIDYTQIRANNIWVRAGSIVAGTEAFPFENKLDITLYGNRYGPAIVIDDRSRTGTKSLAVTGRLELYGPIPEVTQTRLTATAEPQDQVIHVEAETESWSVGDELVLGGSAINGEEFEKVKISGINGKEITLVEPLQFYHYGAEKASIGNDGDNAYVIIDERYGNGLDMRTTVGHITRQIRIMGTDEDETGGHLQVYHWLLQEENEQEIIDIDLRGSIMLSGVELNNMGQINSDNAGIHILHTSTEGAESKVTGSSIHDCQGICVNLLDTYYTRFIDNVIYNGQQFLIQNIDYRYTTITHNLLIGAVSNPYTSIKVPETFIYMWSNYNPEVDGVLVEYNVGQSTKGLGYAFPSTPCDQRDSIAFKNNEAGNCGDGGFVYNFNRKGCFVGGHNAAYHAFEGITVHSAGTTEVGWELEQNILVECTTGIIMRSGSKNNYLHHSTLRDTYISGVVLGEVCPECYTAQHNKKHFRCSDSFGGQLLLTNLVGNTCPLDLGSLGLKAICNEPVISSAMYITNSEFVNIRDDYSTSDNLSHLGQVCGNNRVFKTNSDAAESQAAHFLKNTQCTNCDVNGMFRLTEPKEAWRGWFGGCGVMDCTGLENVLVQDITGDFFGFEGTAISNNEDVGYGFVEEGNMEMKDSCSWVEAWNGFLCRRTDLVQLQWEGIGEDSKLLSTAPVVVRNDYFKNEVNMWREWEWIGPEPQNRRQNSFVALALVNQRHTITYSGTQAMDTIHKLSERSPVGEQDRYIIIENQYFNPLTLEVLVGGNQVPSYSFKYPEDLGLHTTECGANNYFYQNNTIHFVVTNVPTCQVQVQQVNFVQINMRIGMSQEDFLDDDDAESTFVNRIIGFLEIPFDKVRIVGIVEDQRRQLAGVGETDINVVIKGNAPGTYKSLYSPANEYVALRDMAQSLQDAIEQDQIQDVISAKYDVYVVKQAGTAEEDEDFFSEADLVIDGGNTHGNKKTDTPKKQKEEEAKVVAVALGVIFGLIAIIMVGLIVYHFYARKALNQVKNLPEAQQIQQQEQVKSADAISQRSSNKLFEEDK